MIQQQLKTRRYESGAPDTPVALRRCADAGSAPDFILNGDPGILDSTRIYLSTVGDVIPAQRVLVTTFFVVYIRYMSRINVNIDDQACAEVMRRYRLTTKREAINFALRSLAAKPLSIDEARLLRGSGWEGDLDTLRSSRMS